MFVTVDSQSYLWPNEPESKKIAFVGFIKDMEPKEDFVLEDLSSQTPLKLNCQEIPIFTNHKKRGLEHIELPAKPLHYFLRSNKSNINQWGVSFDLLR